MDFLNDIGIYASIFGFISLAAGAAGYFKASRGDSIIKYQTIEITNLRTKISDLEKEKLELEAEKKAIETSCLSKDEQIHEMSRQNKYLQKLGQGSPQLKKLTTAVENQTKLISQLLEREGKI